MPWRRDLLSEVVPNALPYILRILAVRRPDRKKARLVGGIVPAVDILVTCCNEEIGVIIDTIRAACVLDYPQDRFRVFVCDDGASQELQKEISTLAITYPNVYYTSRIKGPVKDYKAGNLNHGLLFSSQVSKTTSNYHFLGPSPPALSLSIISRSTISFHSSTDAASMLDSRPSTWAGLIEKGTLSGSMSSEYVAGLDADMIPEPHWLRTILPHLIDDPDVALACPPQVGHWFLNFSRGHCG